MPKSYDQDLRKKVILYLAEGHSHVSASKVFNIALNTVKNWYKRYNSEGHFNTRDNKGKQPRISREEFETYVESNPDKTLAQIGEHFDMSASGAGYYMRKFGFRGLLQYNYKFAILFFLNFVYFFWYL